jgi:hypothetical protein
LKKKTNVEKKWGKKYQEYGETGQRGGGYIFVMKFFIPQIFHKFSSSPPSVIELVQPGTCPA